ncbi:MAG: DUF885 family protein [Candidatus Avelusimicrobium sp.]|uniref:DUF885 family protein n=1 Tax=Candidatus Avelusimicrobium sp. TaxID=3048833 RepID=UPI003F12AA9B
MTNKTLPLLLAAYLCIFAFIPARAQEAFDFENIDSLLEENTLIDVSNRYAAVLQNYLPERAARLGYGSAAAQLNDRSAETQLHALRALQNVREKLKDVNVKNLSESKKVDFRLLQNALNNDIRRTEQSKNNPLYYTEAFDAVYDVYLNDSLSPAKKRADLSARITALANTADQAEKNLSQPSAFLAQLAMEKAYYAYLSFDELAEYLMQNAPDDFSTDQARTTAREAKRSVRRMFDLFKKLSQNEDGQDFRLGEESYAQLLSDEYQINISTAKLVKKLENNTKTARRNLSAALELFLTQTDAEEEITLLEDSNDVPQTVPKKKTKKKKAKKGKPVLRNAQDFYAVAKRTAPAKMDENAVSALQSQVAALSAELAQKNIFSAKQTVFNVRQAPRYYAYTHAFVFRPAYLGAAPQFLLRLPAGNNLAKEEQLKRDFNTPVLKLLTAKQLVPGGYYQEEMGKNWSVWRKSYPASTTANGWKEYGALIAKEQNYIVTDDELLYYAWDGYRRALAAETDAKLQTKRFSYTDALNYLTQENGLEQAEAEQMLKDLASRAGEAVSRQEGLEIWQNAREKFRKKLGKKFNEADFHQKALQTGNVPPADVEAEISRLYEKEKRQAKRKNFF